jgi:uncharacterized protein with ParB-like and HNH nuclease domain
MDLKGAEVRNFYEITHSMEQSEAEASVKINIPFYQRPYKWEKSNVKALIDDWKSESIRSKNSKYFAGSIVTVAHDEKHDLVDGQQRFTTIFLANYLLMLILRVSIREAISQNKPLVLRGLYDDFKISFDNLFCADEESKIFTSEAGIHEDIFQNPDQETQRDALANKWCKEVNLPPQQNAEHYVQQYEGKLGDYITNNKLKLVYSRSSYNELLVDSLKKVTIKLSNQDNLTIKTGSEDFPENTPERKILDAVDQLFNSFKVEAGLKSFDNAKDTIKLIKDFLKELKVCVIQTGNPNDAFTLFEVLNDRFMVLDDLDLIKNMFYKTFCLDSREKNNKVIDKKIDECEVKWIEIFNNQVPKRRRLIAYLATSFISGNKDISLKSNHGYRSSISQYLKDNYDRKDKDKLYTQNQLTKDFNIFNAVMLILKEFGVFHTKVANKAVEAEYSDRTITYKTVHLLHALDLPGVLAGLINFILRYIDEQKEVEDFDPEEVKKIIEALKGNDDEHTEVHNQAKNFWKCALLSADHKAPWELATRVILSSNRSSVGAQLLHYYDRDNPGISLSGWADGWKFKEGTQKTKIRVLFARLIKLDYDFEKNQLKEDYAFFQNLPNPKQVKNLQLDHMEPKNPDLATYGVNYFKDDNSEDIINSLGNIMPLPRYDNIRKSNDPMNKIFPALENAGLGDHWLTVRTLSILEKNNRTTVGGLKIPKANFFVVRKKFLIKCFNEAINNE